MPESAESHMVALTTNRVCVIEMKNDSRTYCLYNPVVHMESGFPFSPPTPTLRPGMMEVCSFTKDDNTASGAVGLLSYDLFNMRDSSCTDKIIIMFSVPFDYNFYVNWLGVGVFCKDETCDEKMFKKMYNDKDKSEDEDSTFRRYKADGSGISYRGNKVEIRATMNDEGRAIVKVELFDKLDL